MWDASTNDASMNLYIQEKIRADTAYEINENNQSTYVHDVLYLVFKLLLFVVLGIVFYYLLKNEKPEVLVAQVKEKAAQVTSGIDQVAKVVKEKVEKVAQNPKTT